MGQLASLFDDDKPKASLNLRFGIEAKPDEVAREAQLAKRFGLPPGVIAEYRPDFEARAKVEDAQPLLEQAPKLRGWLAADVKRAEIAHDDIGPLSAIESAVRYMVSAPDAPRGGLAADAGFVAGMAKAAIPGMASKAYGAAAAPFGVADHAIQALDDLAASITGTQRRQIVGTPGPESFFLNESKSARQKAQAAMPDMTGWKPEARGLVSGFQSGLENLLVMPVGLASGGEAAMLGIMGALTGGDSYAKAREKGVNPAQSFAYGVQDATAEIITEKYMGAAGLLRNIKAGASAGKLFMYELAKEVPGEMAATLWQNFNEWQNLSPEKSVADFVLEQPDALRETIVATLVGGSVQIGTVKGVERAMRLGDQQIIKADDAQKRADALTEAATLIEAGKLRNRDPEAFAEFADELVANDVPNLYIDAQTLSQSGINMDEVLQAMPSVAAQIERAIATGGDLVIPTSEFLTITPGKPFAAALIENARTAADAMSPVEAKQYMAERGDTLNAEIARVLEERQADDAFQAQRQEVKDYFLGQLNATKRFTPDVNDAYASLMANFFGAMSTRAQMSPMEMLQRNYGLKVSAESVAGARTMEQGEPDPTGEFDEATGLALNSDGTVTVYHHTSAANAAEIRRTGLLKSAAEPDLYFTTTPDTDTGYGDTAVPFRVMPDRLLLDGAFPDGRQDFRVETRNASKSRRVRFLPDGSAVLNQFAGQNASTITGVDEQNLASAKRRLANREDPERVRRETGWFEGVDGKWRFEISDDDALLLAPVEPGDADRPLSEVLQHPRLFAAYPDLAGVMVGPADALADYRGAYYPQADRIKLAKAEPDAQLSTLLHEVQHAIQHREGFAVGGNTDSDFASSVKAALSNLEGASKEAVEAWKWRNDWKIKDAEQAAFVSRQGLMYESALRLMAYADRDAPSGVLRLIRNEMQWLYDPQFRGNAAAQETQREWFALPKRHRAQARNAFLSDLANKAAKVLLDEISPAQIERFKSDERTMKGMLASLSREAQRKYAELKPLRDLERTSRNAGAVREAHRYSTPYDIYRALAGEVEARNTQARQKLTDDERRTQSPMRTADTPAEKIVVMFGGLDIQAPNASALNQPAGNQTETPAFKRWFGDSKVVDAQGKPLVVYHGTGEDGIAAPNVPFGGMYLTAAPAVAEQYASLRGGDVAGKVESVYVRATNVFDPAAPGAAAVLDKIESKYDNKTDYLDPDDGEYMPLRDWVQSGYLFKLGRDVQNEVMEALAAEGYDAVRYRDASAMTGDSESLVVFDPTQIKSAIGNNGNYDPKNPSILEQAGTLNKDGAAGPRAQITFAQDITQAPSVMALFKDADLSSFIHESGHFYLEVMGDLAWRIQAQINDGSGVSDGERGIVADMNRLLDWFGVKGSEQQSALDEWLTMAMEDRREMHERFARGFELYAFEGKAPSVELGKIFRSFRAWLMNVYRALTNLAARDTLQVTLTDEVRGVMDRMLATDEQIAEAEAARGMGPLFKTQEQAGMTADEWKAYNDRALDATAQAIESLQARGLKDMQWLQNARGRKLKELQKRADGLRREVRTSVRAEVMSRPVYRAWQFLTGKDAAVGKTDAEVALAAERADHRDRRAAAEAAAAEAEKARVLAENPDAKGIKKAQALQKAKRQMAINVEQAMLTWDQENPAPAADKPAKAAKSQALDPSVDSLLVAIAKLGGINRDSASRDAGVSADSFKTESGVFGKPVFRKDGGFSADSMAAQLAELHYLPVDEHGKHSLHDLEEAIGDELSGSPRYSYFHDYAERYREGAEALPDDVVFGKLDTGRLREMYGNKADAAWRKLSALRMTSETAGYDPDVVAATFDFSSGDELVKAIAEATPPREVIEALTDERMLTEFGDLATPEGLERAADAAIHSDARARFVAAEFDALERANNVRQGVPGTRRTVDVLAKAAKDYAEGVISALRIRDLRPDRYEAAEARAARNAIKAMKEGDTEKAAAEKRSQMIQSAAARAAIAAQNEMDRARDYFKRLSKGNKSIDRSYQDQIDALLERVELRQISDKASDRRKSLADWVEDQRAMGLEPDIPDHLLDSAARKSYRDMTVEEVRGLRDTIRNIEHLGRLKRKLLAARDRRDFDAAADELAASIIANGGGARPVELEGEKGFKPWLEGVAASHRKLSSLFRQMDGGDDNGPAYQLLGRGMNERGSMEDAMTERATVALSELYAPVMKMRGGVSGASSKLHIPEIGASLTRGGRLAVALNWGNEQNRQRIRDGDKWTDAQVQAILRTLTTEELAFVNGMWAYLDTFWPEIAAKEKRLSGKEPERVAAVPFVAVAADGTEVQMRGGYYPLKYDSDRSDKAERQEAAEVAKDMMRGAFTRATTRRGHTKARAEEVKRAVRKDLGVITQHVTQVIHDLAWHEWLIDTNRLLSDDRVVDAIRAHYGPKVLKTMRDGVMGIATADVVPMTDVDKALLLLRSNVTRATMGASLTTAFLQPFGLTQSMVRIGPKHVLRGLARWGGEAVRMENSLAWIHEKSDFMRLRSKTFNREIRDISGRVAGKSAAMQAVDGGLFWLTQKMQLVADVPTWIGQYEKSIAEGANEADAVAMADRAVIEAQGSGSTKDMAEVQRKHPMLTQFYSYFSVTMNLTAERTAATDFKNPRAVAGWLGDMALLLVIPAILPAMLMEGMKGGGDDDEEELAKKIAKWQLGYLMGMVVGVRELSGMVSGFDYAGPPVGRIVSDLSKAAKQTAQGEIDEPAVLAYVRLMGDAFGIPVVQAIRSYKGWKAWDEGEDGAGPQSVLLGPPVKD